MCNYSSVPVSKHNTFPSASKAWQRIAFFAATYGGGQDLPFYNKLLVKQECIEAIAQLQAAGVQFTGRQCFHWAVELCGSFEVTHSQYKVPKGSELPPATILYNAVNNLFEEMYPT